MLSALGIVVVDWAVGGQWAEPKMCRKHKPKLFYRFENEAGKPKKVKVVQAHSKAQSL